MRKITADYIFPINRKPIEGGILIFDNSGEIIDLFEKEKADYEINDIEIYEGIICPGFVNSHCHLELSYLKGRIPEGSGLNDFIMNLESLKREAGSQNSEVRGQRTELIKKADEEMFREGIVAVGDISNTDATYEIKTNSRIRYHNFIEIYGSDRRQAKNIFTNALTLFDRFSEISDCSIVPHSAYSVSKSLFQRIKKFADEKDSILSMHHQESEDENLYFLNGSGNIPERARHIGLNVSASKPTGLRPLASIIDYLPKENNIQLVHNTVSQEKDIETALKHFINLWWCLCPKSNYYIQKRFPDVQLFIDNKCDITIGTDSLASNDKLSMIEEMKTINKTFPGIELHEILKWATLNGAKFLIMDRELGSFEKGKAPGINLIEDIDLTNLRLTEKSRVRRI
jgi:cytosine/adenosine deaminase-related metal-dependent hydrolase